MSRRTPLIVLGAVVLAIGGLAALTGAALAAFFASGDTIATGPHPVTTPTRALVSSVAELDGLGVAPGNPEQARVEIDATGRAGGPGVFVGVGRAADVDRYLAGADVDVVTDLEVSPFALSTRHQPGTAVVPAPGSQSFWVARAEASSGTARLSWPVQDGDYRVVLMNADASQAFDADARFAVALPAAHGIGVAVLVTGLVLTLLGGLALTMGLRTPKPAGPPPPGGAAPAPLVPAAKAPDGNAGH